MANLFRAPTRFFYQQTRFLQHLSEVVPEKYLNPNKAFKNQESSNKTSVTREKSNAKSTKSKKLVSLVIKPKANRDKSKPSVTEQLLKDSGDPNGPTVDRDGNIVYTKMANEDPRIYNIMSKVKVQNNSKLILLEGKRLIREAMLTGCKMEYLIFSRLKEVEYLKPYLPETGNLYKMPYKEMQIWSDLTTNPGIMGIFKTPSSENFAVENPLPLTIICDNIKEPNNLGSILRASSGVGCQQIFLINGCVNVWDPKVLRSACGAHFRSKIIKDVNWPEIPTKLPEECNVFLAESECENLTESSTAVPLLPYYSVDFKIPQHIVLIIGGETEGLSEESYKLALDFNGARLNVPLSNGMDSLNVGTALGVIAFEIKRQICKSQTIDNE